MKLDFSKNFNEIKEDFKILSIKRQAQELRELMNTYSFLVAAEAGRYGELTDQTKTVKQLYDILRFEHEKQLDAAEAT